MDEICLGVIGVLFPVVGLIWYKIGGVEAKLEGLYKIVDEYIKSRGGKCD